jgi:hypothetical protein
LTSACSGAVQTFNNGCSPLSSSMPINR